MGQICCCRRSLENAQVSPKRYSQLQNLNLQDCEAEVVSTGQIELRRPYKGDGIADVAVNDGRNNHGERNSIDQEEQREINQLRDQTSVSASDGIDPGESSNLSDRNKSDELEIAGHTISFADKRREDVDMLKKQLNEEIKKCEEDEIKKKEQIKQLAEDRQEFDDLKRQFSEERRKYEQDLQRNKEKIKQLEEDKNELLIRLSSQAAARMTYNNPNITDLSDKNRPTKISERYSELYDNQWTDAFENLQTKHHLSDTEAIQFLLDVLYTSFDVCKEARKQREGLLNALKNYIGVDGNDQDVTIQEVMRTLKGTGRNIKEMQKTFKENVEKRLATETKDKEKLEDITLYMNECVDVCLLMNIQEPPVELYRLIMLYDTQFDVSAFRPYTKTGNIIEYIVWPAMYLYQDGPLLCKGVAQGKCSSFNVDALTSAKDNANEKKITQELSGQQTYPKDNYMYVQVPNEINVNIEKQTEILNGSSSSAGLHRENEKQNNKPDSSQYTDTSRKEELTMTTSELSDRTVQQENVDKLQIMPSEKETSTEEITHL